MIARRLERSYYRRLRMKKKLAHAMNEIVTSERSYCTNLGILKTEVIDQLRWGANTSKNPIMAEDDIKRMFCNWDQLFVLSQDFVERFEKRLQKVFPKEQNSTKQVLTPSLAAYAKISSVFSELLPFCKIYKEYIKNYDIAVATVKKLSEESEKFVSEACIACMAYSKRMKSNTWSDLHRPNIFLTVTYSSGDKH